MVQRRIRPSPAPLDPAALDALALVYVGKYATTRAKLIRYLTRKLRERGAADDTPIDAEAIADRMVERGYVDDAGFARNRASALLARGFGARRVNDSLRQAGIDREIVSSAVPGDDDTARAAAETYARRRCFGVHGPGAVDPAQARRQLAAMLRAGHDYAVAIAVLNPDRS